MFGIASRDHAADLAVARETASWWHDAARRERERADMAEESAKLWSERYARIVERLLASATGTLKSAATPSSSPQEAAAEPSAPAGPPEAVVAAIRRMAGNDQRTLAHLTRWVMEPEQAARWREPRSVPGLIDEICRGKR